VSLLALATAAAAAAAVYRMIDEDDGDTSFAGSRARAALRLDAKIKC